MIESFSLKSVATYDENGVIIKNLNKINFIYGGNGCGKTTISNFLTDTTDKKYTNCNINWNNNKPLQTLVYNKSFRDKNFGSSNIAGVFTLGQASTEEIEKINNKKTELEKEIEGTSALKKTLASAEFNMKEKESNFKEVAWKTYKKYEIDFKEAFRGFIGSKASFKNKVLDEYHNNTSTELKTLKDLKERATVLFSDAPIEYEIIPELTGINLKEIEDDILWVKNIIGKSDVDIANLINFLNNNDWVNQGRKYLNDSKKCPFCQKDTIDEAFKSKLEDYFDGSFTDDVEKLKNLSERYVLYKNKIEKHIEYINELFTKNPIIEMENIKPHILPLTTTINKNISSFNLKIEKTSLEIHTDKTHDLIEKLNQSIKIENEKINKHNTLVNTSKSSLQLLKKDTWFYLINEIKNDISQFAKDEVQFNKINDNLTSKINEKEKKEKKITLEIRELNKSMTSVQPTVDEINSILLSFGFANFKIVPSTSLNNHYCIQRPNGDFVENTLSEGEVTFITFLYFYQLAKGALSEDLVSENRILVIDDPISSLDSNILYIVSSLVKKIIRDIKETSSTNIKQLILLTHNVYFHKEASFQNGRSNGCKHTHFWVLRKSNDVTSINYHAQNNPIESSYELLWREIKDKETCSEITIQNTMRRILENYFKILGKFSDEDIISKFNSPEQQQVCKSLLYWINDGSHCIPDDLYIQRQGDSIDIYLSVFKDIFKLTGHESHYDMMMN
ncbi:AAA family ATPase [Providencia rettgeri]|uniref:AAA family ATPase n=1 Tax=Providencia rettgeri TaxID=587 RepID=UPI003523C34A